MEFFLQKNKTRAQTRFNLTKKKKECSSYFWLFYLDSLDYQDKKNIKKKIGKIAHNPKGCSCWMCGNPRRKYKGRRDAKLTLAEKKNFDSMSIEHYLKYENDY